MDDSRRSAGLVNSARLKGIHLAIKSGMLAAETAFEALKKDDSSAAMLGEFQKKVESSWIKEELWKVRNMHQGFEGGMFAGMFHTGLQMITGGRGVRNRYRAHAGYEHMRKLAELPADGGAGSAPARPSEGRRQAHLRQADGSVSLRHEARRRPARASGHSRHRHLQFALRQRISAARARIFVRQMSTRWSTMRASRTANASA